MINFSSISFKTTILLVSTLFIFLLGLFLITNQIVAENYKSNEAEKLEKILNDTQVSLSVTMMYNSDNAIKDIASELLENENILYIKIIKEGILEPYTFSKSKKNPNVLIENENFVDSVVLIDPITNENIGSLEIIYSNNKYLQLKKRFTNILLGIFLISFIIIILLIKYIFKSLEPMKKLALRMASFDPQNPQSIDFHYTKKDEIFQIMSAASKMVNNIIVYNNSIQELNDNLTQREQHLKNAQRLAHVGSWEYDVEKNIFDMSDEMYRILGINLNHKLQELNLFISRIADDDRDIFISTINNAIKDGSKFSIRHKMLDTNLKTIDINTQGKVRKKANGSIKLSAVSMDVTEWNASQKLIEQLAYYDTLTLLPNRLLLKDRIHEAIKDAKRYEHLCAILFIDLDHFKLINDTLGHDTGDLLLKEVASRLTEHMREIDTVSRIGGDEFVILLPKITKREDAMIVAEKIIQDIKAPCFINNHKLYVTTSIGISIYPEHATDIDRIVKNADIAMYEAKEIGRNNYVIFDPSMSKKVSYQMHLEHDMREAILKSDQFEVYFQPQINLQTNSINSVEALIRWNHPKEGLLFPDSFIPFCESTGLIIDLGYFVIEECIKQISQWENTPHQAISIAINLSGRQFQHDGLLSYVKYMLEKYKIDPSKLEFEITESISMANIKESLRIMNELKNLGAKISIDDFGTGYSSLASLKEFPADILKIDKSFVISMLESQNSMTLVKTIIALAHSMGMKVIAEGAETKEHIEKLSEFGCDLAQGYYYCKAIRQDELQSCLVKLNS